MRKNSFRLMITVGFAFIYLVGLAPTASTYPPFLKKATSLGLPAKDCTFCHKNPTGGEGFNERGTWLLEEKKKRNADMVDVAWLKEYKEGNASSGTNNSSDNAKPASSEATMASHGAAQGGRGKAELTVKKSKISIDYGRPSLKGRDMLSKANVGMIWRLGKDQATKLETTGDLKVNGKDLKAGTYTIGAKKTGEDSWVLVFHPKTDLPGGRLPESGYVAELPLKHEKVKDSVEDLTINLTEKAGEAAIKIQWGTSVLSGSLGVS